MTTSIDQLEKGKQWILTRFNEIADEERVTFSDLRWSVREIPLTLQWTLGFKSPKGFHSMRFDRKDIDDAPNNSSAQRSIEGKIRAYLKSIPNS